MNQSKLTALGRTALFASLNASELEEMAGLMTDHQVSAGDWLFHTGDEATAFFIVVSGRLEAVDEAHDAVLRDVGPGEWIGEFGVIAGEARSAGVRAVRDSQLWAISDTSFTELLDRHRGIQRHVLRVLAQLLRQSRPAQEIRRNGIIGIVSTRRGISAPGSRGPWGNRFGPTAGRRRSPSKRGTTASRPPGRSSAGPTGSSWIEQKRPTTGCSWSSTMAPAQPGGTTCSTRQTGSPSSSDRRGPKESTSRPRANAATWS